MTDARQYPSLWRAFALMMLVLALLAGASAQAQQTNNIAAELVAEGPAVPGQELTVAIHFIPSTAEWHGYWSNPGDAGYGMQLNWKLPQGWTAGEPIYPVPKRLVIADLMNHVFEGPYAVLVPITVPKNAAVANQVPLSVDALWLACTDEICVPEEATLTLDVSMADQAGSSAQFDSWRAAIPPMLDREARYQVAGNRLRIAIPLPAALDVGQPHIFVEQKDFANYGAVQTFTRDGDVLVGEIALNAPDLVPGEIAGIFAFGEGNGVRFMAQPGEVPQGGVPLTVSDSNLPPLWTLLLGALLGGLVLNILPCVFPILSLKALSLARAGGDEASARGEGLAYTAGAIIASLSLGAILLLLRAGGENIGWAFQLQEPGVVVALLALAVAITANLSGLYELPSISLTRSGAPSGAFATGLLAAFVATPCTGPFMAAALGAALVLPPFQALLLFGVLGLGLALPFLAIGFVPALRRMLPKPGQWMENFRKIMAIPMGLTALALLWLCWRLGGDLFGWLCLALSLALVVVFVLIGRSRQGAPRGAVWLAPIALAVAGIAFLPTQASDTAAPSESALDPSEFSDAALAEARTSRQPVFVWFTADWCVTCKVNEQVAIEREATRAAFEKAGVVTLRGDWTRRDAEITGFLTRQGAAGVPLYLWYEPSGEAEVLPQVLTPDALVTLAQRPRGTPR